MLANAGFLLVALGVSIVGSLLLWLRHRKPRSTMSSVDEFQREMTALGRRPREGPPERRWSSSWRRGTGRPRSEER